MGGEQFDAVVVGSGHNGLAAAIVLAQAGLSVAVYEARETIGGGARTAELTLPGFRHDICSAIHPMAAGSPFLNTLPLADHGLRWIHPDLPLAHPLDDAPAVLIARDIEESCESLGEDAARYRKLVSPFAARWEELAEDALAPLGFPRSPLLMGKFGLKALKSLSSLAKGFQEPRTKALWAGQGAHAVLPLDVSPSAAIAFLLQTAAHAVGWPLPQGGSQAIVEAMASLLREEGGVIHTGVRVENIDALPTTGPILLEVSPSSLSEIAGDALPEAFHKELRAFRHGPGVFKVDYALSGPIPWRDPGCARAGTVHLGGTFEEIAASERAPWEGAHAEHPFVLLAQQSLFDSHRAPAGQHTAWAYCHVPSGSTRDMTREIEAQIERFAPGFQDLVLARHCMNTEDFQNYNANYIGGDIVGGATDLGQVFFRPTSRRVPYSTPNPRLFLCSASTPPGGGVHGMCGSHAARAALKTL